MRCGTWILAWSAAAALAAPLATAADTPVIAAKSTKPVAKPAAGSSASPTAKKPAAADPSSADKLYVDLFGEEPEAAAAKAPSAKSAANPAVRPAVVATPTARSAAAAKSSAPATTEDNSAIFATTESEPEATAKQPVVNAGYGTTGKADRNLIQQMRAEEPRSTSKPAGPIRQTANKSGVPVSGEVASQVPAISVEWIRRSDINVGQECALELLVKNNGSSPASQIEVDAFFPSSVRLTSVDPKPAQATDRLTWTFEQLAAGAEHKIAVKLVPSRRGELATSAQVRLTGTSSAMFRVEEPLLKLAVKGPAEVQVGDPATQTITITNPGTGVAHDVVIEAEIPEGLEYAKGKKLLMEVGSINPGETQTVRLALTATKGGHHQLNINARSSSDAAASASCAVDCVAPELQLAIEGPGLRYKGRSAKYTITVTNAGAVPTSNVRIAQVVPDGFKFVSADKGGKYESTRRAIQWFAGRVEPKQTLTFSCELQAVTLGEFSHIVQAISDAGVKAETRKGCSIEGSASLAMEIVDLDDPVEVGNETAYEIKVRNDGSKAASNVSITCELPTGVDVLSAKGPADSLTENRLIVFKGLKELAPGQMATYRVHIRGTEEGNHRIRVRLTSDSIQEPLLLEEQTKFYSDAR